MDGWIDWLVGLLPDWLIHWLIDWWMDGFIGWLIDLLPDWLIDWLIDWSTEWLIDLLTDWLSEWLIDWLTDWLTIDWLVDWYIDCLSNGLTDWLIEILSQMQRYINACSVPSCFFPFSLPTLTSSSSPHQNCPAHLKTNAFSKIATHSTGVSTCIGDSRVQIPSASSTTSGAGSRQRITTQADWAPPFIGGMRNRVRFYHTLF
jgi:hypothetical protein